MSKLSTLFPGSIIQAPLAGGMTTPELVSAVCNAGGVGSLAASTLAPMAIEDEARRIRCLTTLPFAINLFVQPKPPRVADCELEAAKLLLKPVWSRLGFSELPTPTAWCLDFEQQLDALIAARPAVASFCFDILSAEQVRRLHAAGILVVGTATNVEEAVRWKLLGVDGVCLQGTEAGGHRGTFIGPHEASTLKTLPLLNACLPHLGSGVAIVAAGGVMDGAGIHAALSAGAHFVQMGTAFLTTFEAGTSAAYKQRLLDQTHDTTRQTRVFSGRLARGIDNEFMKMMQVRPAGTEASAVDVEVLPYPIQNALTGAIRLAAAKSGNTEFMSLWAGQGVHKCRSVSVAELMRTLALEYSQALRSVPT